MQITSIGESNRDYFVAYTGDLIPSKNALGLIEEGQAAGAAVFSVNDNILFMDSLYVREEYRRRGGGTMILDAAKECAHEIGIGEIMTYYGESGEATSFLEKSGFTCFPGDPVYSLSAGEVVESNNFKRVMNLKKDPSVVTMEGITTHDLSAVSTLLTNNGFYHEILNEGNYDLALSVVGHGEDGTPKGVLLSRKEGDNVVVTALCVDDENYIMIRRLLSAYAVILLHAARPKSRLVFIGRNEKLADTLGKMLGMPLQNSGYVWSAIYIEQ